MVTIDILNSQYNKQKLCVPVKSFFGIKLFSNHQSPKKRIIFNLVDKALLLSESEF